MTGGKWDVNGFWCLRLEREQGEWGTSYGRTDYFVPGISGGTGIITGDNSNLYALYKEIHGISGWGNDNQEKCDRLQSNAYGKQL